MTTYKAVFPEAAAGREVVVRNPSGSTVVTETLGAASAGSVVHTLTRDDATEQVYIGTVGTDLTGYLQAVYQLDTVASIAAAGGGGGIDPAGTDYVFEVANGMTAAVDGIINMVFDTVPDGQTPGTTFSLPEGLYLCYIEVDFADPPANRWVTVAVVQGQGYNDRPQGPYPIFAGLSNYTGHMLFSQITLNRSGTDSMRVTLAIAAPGDEVSPPDVVIDYAYVKFTKIA